MDLGIFSWGASQSWFQFLPLFILPIALQLVIPNLSSYVWLLRISTLSKSQSHNCWQLFDWRKTPRHCQTLLHLISESIPCFHLVGKDKDNCRSWPNANSVRPLLPYELNGGRFRPYVLCFPPTSKTWKDNVLLACLHKQRESSVKFVNKNTYFIHKCVNMSWSHWRWCSYSAYWCKQCDPKSLHVS